MSGSPTYLFGVGATKAGTTWMYRYLAAHPECHLRSVKELHFFDSLDKGFDRQIKVNRDKLERVTAELAVAPAARAERLRGSARDLAEWLAVLEKGEDLTAYRAYLEGWRGAKRVVGDITPAYADLSGARLNQMLSTAADHRVVYLLRDPVSRFWSHVRMVAGRSRAGQADFALEAGRVVDRVLAGEPSEIAKRSDYQGALTRLWATVAPERLLVLFQERLFSAPGLSQLCRFLGIRAKTADTAVRVHEGLPLAMTPMQKARIRAFLQPQYDFVAKAFPALPDSWHATRDGVTA